MDYSIKCSNFMSTLDLIELHCRRLPEISNRNKQLFNIEIKQIQKLQKEGISIQKNKIDLKKYQFHFK